MCRILVLVEMSRRLFLVVQTSFFFFFLVLVRYPSVVVYLHGLMEVSYIANINLERPVCYTVLNSLWR